MVNTSGERRCLVRINFLLKVIEVVVKIVLFLCFSPGFQQFLAIWRIFAFLPFLLEFLCRVFKFSHFSVGKNVDKLLVKRFVLLNQPSLFILVDLV